MPEPTAANPGGGGQQPNQQQNQSFFAKYGSQVLHMLVIWTAIRFITNGNNNKNIKNKMIKKRIKMEKKRKEIYTYCICVFFSISL